MFFFLASYHSTLKLFTNKNYLNNNDFEKFSITSNKYDNISYIFGYYEANLFGLRVNIYRPDKIQKYDNIEMNERIILIQCIKEFVCILTASGKVWIKTFNDDNEPKRIQTKHKTVSIGICGTDFSLISKNGFITCLNYNTLQIHEEKVKLNKKVIKINSDLGSFKNFYILGANGAIYNCNKKDSPHSHVVTEICPFSNVISISFSNTSNGFIYYLLDDGTVSGTNNFYNSGDFKIIKKNWFLNTSGELFYLDYFSTGKLLPINSPVYIIDFTPIDARRIVILGSQNEFGILSNNQNSDTFIFTEFEESVLCFGKSAKSARK